MTISDKLIHAAEIRARLVKAEPFIQVVKDLNAELIDLRQEILADLIASKSRGTDYIDGLRATRTKRKTLVVTDPAALYTWIENNAPEPSVYFKPDMKALGYLANEVFKKIERTPDGTAFEERESIKFEDEK